MYEPKRTEPTVYGGLNHHLATNGIHYIFCHIQMRCLQKTLKCVRDAFALLSKHHQVSKKSPNNEVNVEIQARTLLRASLASLNKDVLRRLHMLVSLAFALRKAKASLSAPRTPFS